MNRLPVISNVLTATRLRTFRRCAREHHYEYELGYRAVAEGEAVRFGRLIHAALAAWWRTRKLDAALVALEAAASAARPWRTTAA